MTKRKVFIQNEEFIPEVAEITGTNVIFVEYQFRRAEILDIVCMFEVELTAEQAAEIDRRAKVRREKTHEVPETRELPVTKPPVPGPRHVAAE